MKFEGGEAQAPLPDFGPFYLGQFADQLVANWSQFSDVARTRNLVVAGTSCTWASVPICVFLFAGKFWHMVFIWLAGA